MSIWFDFLATQNALDFKYPDFSSTDGAPLLIPMLQHQLFQVTGPDAVKFLQGQLTCDLRRLEQHDHLLGGHCNAKGRMISSFTLAGQGAGTVGLRLRHNLAEVALTALRKYLVFSKARIEVAPLVPLALMGNPAQLPYENLPNPGKSLYLGETVLLRHSEDLLEIWTPEAIAVTLWQQLVPACTPASVCHLDRFWVDRGVVELQSGISEEFVPQMLNYDLIDGISFKKGCYTGQEIIARMHYKGQAKKHTYAMHCSQPLDLKPGDTLTGADDEKILATVAASAPGLHDWRGLVVTTDESRENEAFLREKKTGAKLTWTPLPYAIPKQ